MKTSWLFAGMLLLAGCGGSASEGDVTGKNPETIDGFAITKIEGTSLQRADKLDVNGLIVETGLLAQGKRSGTWTKFHPGTSKPAIMASYIDGKYNGPYLEFDQSSQITLQAFYTDNLLEGYWAKYQFGQLTFEATYNRGKLDGKYKEFRGDGGMSKEITYKNGLLDGPYRFFDDAGNVVLEYTYRNGEKVGN